MMACKKDRKDHLKWSAKCVVTSIEKIPSKKQYFFQHKGVSYMEPGGFVWQNDVSQFGVPTDRIFWHTCHISNFKNWKIGRFCNAKPKHVLVKKWTPIQMLANQDFSRQNIMFCQTKWNVSSDKTAKMKVTYKRLHKLVLSYKRASQNVLKRGTGPWSRVCLMLWNIAEPVDMLDPVFSNVQLFIFTQVHQNKNSHSCWEQTKDNFLLHWCRIHAWIFHDFIIWNH